MDEQPLQQQRPWLNRYPDGVPTHLDLTRHASLADLLQESFRQHAALPAMRFMGRSWSFGELDRLSRRFAAFAQSQGLQAGDRVAVMLPNVPQYPVVVCGLIRAGLVVVNVNPLYTAPELEHQLQDADVKLFSTAGGDPAINGLYTYLALFTAPDGWTRIYMIGNFNSWDVIEESPTRVVLKVSRSWIEEGTGDVKTADEKLILDVPQDEKAPLMVTPAA